MQVGKRVRDAIRARFGSTWESIAWTIHNGLGYSLPTADVDAIAKIDWTGARRRQVFIGQVDLATIDASTTVAYPLVSIATIDTQHAPQDKQISWSGLVTVLVTFALTWRALPAAPDDYANFVEDTFFGCLHDHQWASAPAYRTSYAGESSQARGPVVEGGQGWVQQIQFRLTFRVDT